MGVGPTCNQSNVYVKKKSKMNKKSLLWHMSQKCRNKPVTCLLKNTCTKADTYISICSSICFI